MFVNVCMYVCVSVCMEVCKGVCMYVHIYLKTVWGKCKGVGESWYNLYSVHHPSNCGRTTQEGNLIVLTN